MSNSLFAARHTMDSSEWYTPSEQVEAAREVMGSIDLDPASHEEANAHIRATTIYTIEDDGLLQPWFGNILHNPPGGFVDAFWKKTLLERDHFTQLIFIGYSLEQLQTLQTDNAVTPLNFPLCFPRKRIAFIENEAKRIARLAKIDAKNAIRKAKGEKLKRRSEKADGPSHANFIAYIGPNIERFADVFRRFGQVKL